MTGIVMVVGASVDVPSILVAGPLFSLIGLLLALLARPLRAWSVLAFGLSAPLICVICAMCIVVFRWNPAAARIPVPALLGALMILSAPLAAIAFKRLYAASSTTELAPSGVQFSLRLLLVVVTGLCILLVIGKTITSAAANPDQTIFTIFAVVTFGAVVVVAALFVNTKRAR